MRTYPVFLVCIGLSLLVSGFGCGGKKNKKIEFNKQDLQACQHVLVVAAGPPLAKLKLGLSGKLIMKGLSQLVKATKNSSFVDELRNLGLIPYEIARLAANEALHQLGYQTSQSSTYTESFAPTFTKVGLPVELCQQANEKGADSVLLLTERVLIDVGATDAVGQSKLWAHLFNCAEKRLIWRGQDKRNLSLRRFIVEATKQVIAKKDKKLADFLGALRKLVEESTHHLLRTGLSRT